jgi:GTP pyrophosphokinase
VSHCVEVAKILADLQLDTTTVAAGLIHDVVEDTTITVEDVEREFGAEVAQIVDGLTKIGNLPMHSKEERQVENYRKLLLSVAKDARVILIKLADRLHNMRTLDYLPPEKRRGSRRRRATCTRRSRTGSAWRRSGGSSRTWRSSTWSRGVPVAREARATKRGRARGADRAAARAARAAAARGRDRRPRRAGAAEAPVVDLQEDEAARAGRTRRSTTSWRSACCRLGARVLPHAGRHPRVVDAGAGAHQGLHRAAQVERLPVAAHDVFGPGKQLFEIQIRTRDMHRTATSASRRTGATRRTTRAPDDLDRSSRGSGQVLELQLDAKRPTSSSSS